MTRIGVLLINIGTPDEPTPEAVGRYLRQFLMDEHVLDLPYLKRWLLVNRVIVPRRKYSSAAHYQKIQSEEGAPLLVHTRKFAKALAEELSNDTDDYFVEIGMRYGNPSIATGLSKLNHQHADRIVVAPLYPQYTLSSFQTAVVETRRQAKKTGLTDSLRFLDPFYVDAGFVEACAEIIKEHLQTQSADHVLLSYHSVPVRHIRKLDPAGFCRINESCCAEITAANQNCYRAQCHATSRAVAAAVGLQPDQFTTCFQSQLGKDEWIGPLFDELVTELPKRGVKNLAVACPSFVADCLETLEEIGITGTEKFREAAGDELTLIPCVNYHPRWISAAADLVRKTAAGSEQAKAVSSSGSV